MEPLGLGWDVDDGNNNWDLNAVLRFASRGPISPLLTTNNNPVVARYAPPPPPHPSYAATILFNGGNLGHLAIAGLPQAQQQALRHQDLPSQPHVAAGWGGGPTLDLPPLLPEPHYTAAAVIASGTPEHQAPPMNNEIPMPPTVQPPADEHTTTPSSSSDCHVVEGSSRRSKKRGKNRKGKDRSKEVHLVPADDTYTTPPDSWAWRKYGEKSIKGTPFHRSYYRCSTDKSCKARKQVQRCLDQPSHLAVSYAGEHSHPMPLVLHCKASTTRSKTPPPPSLRTLPFTICSIPARENKLPLPSAPAAAAAVSLPPAISVPPLRIQDVEQPIPETSATAQAQASHVPVPYLPNTPLPLSPFPNKIPAVVETPALLANTSTRRLQLPAVVSPLLIFQAGEERPAHEILPAPVVPTTRSPPPSVEFDNEEDDDTIDIRMLLEDMDMDMTPEDDALVYVEPEEEEQEHLDGIGNGNGDGNGLLIQQNPEELAPSYSNNNGDKENMMIYPMAYDENALGCSGSNNSLMFPPSPVTYYDYQTAAALGISGSAWTGDGDGDGDGAGVAPCMQPQNPQQPAAAADEDWEW